VNRDINWSVIYARRSAYKAVGYVDIQLSESPVELLRNICDAKQNPVTIRLVRCDGVALLLVGLTPAWFCGGLSSDF
jgi:hypothetical protein